VLLDHHLAARSISAESIRGYNEQLFTHLNVAAAVAAGRADCALGIAAAAQALDLDFVPLFRERYDLVIPLEHVETTLLEPLFKILADRKFRQHVAALPGYDVSGMGTIISEV
jgi:putative molybdopterin biosynthesis protein